MIACNLPSLYTLLGQNSVQSIIKSIRSVISLQSMKSQKSSNSKNFQNLPDEQRTSTESIGPMVPPDVKPASIHGYAMSDFPPHISNGRDDLEQGKIWISSKFEQTNKVI